MRELQGVSGVVPDLTITVCWGAQALESNGIFILDL